MTVAELNDLLRRHPPDARVVVDGYEGGFADPHVRVERVYVDLREIGADLVNCYYLDWARRCGHAMGEGEAVDVVVVSCS